MARAFQICRHESQIGFSYVAFDNRKALRIDSGVTGDLRCFSSRRC
jgi:hypothetical protein